MTITGGGDTQTLPVVKKIKLVVLNGGADKNLGHKHLCLLNIGYVSNETNTDVHMYIEEFILVEIWIHCCTKLN